MHGLVDGSSVHSRVQVLAGSGDPELEVNDTLEEALRIEEREKERRDEKRERDEGVCGEEIDGTGARLERM